MIWILPCFFITWPFFYWKSVFGKKQNCGRPEMESWSRKVSTSRASHSQASTCPLDLFSGVNWRRRAKKAVFNENLNGCQKNVDLRFIPRQNLQWFAPKDTRLASSLRVRIEFFDSGVHIPTVSPECEKVISPYIGGNKKYTATSIMTMFRYIFYSRATVFWNWDR